MTENNALRQPKDEQAAEKKGFSGLFYPLVAVRHLRDVSHFPSQVQAWDTKTGPNKKTKGQSVSSSLVPGKGNDVMIAIL